MKAYLIIIGDEILIGQVQDTNSSWIARLLNLSGIEIKQVKAISDEPEAIVAAFKVAEAEADLVLITGGLGPTKDDLTKHVMAQYFESDMAYHEETWQNLVELFARFNRPLTDKYKPQCFMPTKATILRNKMGTAPGMWFERNGKVFVSMPGVPYEMQYLMENEVMPRLKTGFNLSPIAHRTLLNFGIGETQLQEMIAEVEDKLPAHIKLAYLPYQGGVRLRLTGRGKTEEILSEELDKLSEELIPLLGDSFVCFGNQISFEEAVSNLLRAKGKTLATAESCTGGFISHLITLHPGASEIFQGSVVSYSNELKINVLGVKPESIEQEGVVSETVVAQMAQGLLNIIQADYAIAVSGIAGPSGGTPTKPVGMVCVAVASRDKVVTKTMHFGRSREQFIRFTTYAALNLLRKTFLLD
jgi:nicotinamide-nucleotide amidase